MLREAMRAPVLAAAVSLLGLAGAALALEDDVEITRVQSQHFDVYTDMGPTASQDIALELERGYAVDWQLFFRAPRDPELRCLIYVIRDDDTWASIRAAQGEQHDEVRGFFDADPSMPLFAASLSGSRAVPLRSTLHELAHLFINQYLPYRPFWLNEGLAEYLSTMEIDGATVRLGKVPEERALVLAGPAALLPPAKLMELRKEDETTWTSRRRDYLYAECWAWIHFLVHGKDGSLAGSFERYLTSLGQGPGSKLQDVLPPKTDLDGLDDDFRYYVKRGLYRFRKLEAARLTVAPVLSTTRLSVADSRAALAFIIVRGGGFEGAAAELPKEFALPLGFLASARIQAKQGHLDRSLALLDAGIKQHPDDPYLFLERARLLDDPFSVRTTPDAAARRTADLDHAVALAPWLAAAINDRALVALADGDGQQALSLARRALALRGGEALYYRTLAVALEVSGNSKGAIQVLTGALPFARNDRLRRAMEEQKARLQRELAPPTTLTADPNDVD